MLMIELQIMKSGISGRTKLVKEMNYAFHLLMLNHFIVIVLRLL